jgi:hypothetical protein
VNSMIGLFKELIFFVNFFHDVWKIEKVKKLAAHRKGHKGHMRRRV